MANLVVNLPALRQNVSTVSTFCAARNLDLLLVTKVVQSRKDILEAMGAAGTSRIADIHGANFAPLDPLRHPERAILRPNFAEVPAVARHATRVFLSDVGLARTLGAARASLGADRPLDVTLMVEAGDLRDGVPWNQLPEVVRTLSREPGLRLAGLGTNLGCLAGAVPDATVLEELVDGLRKVRRLTGHPLPGFSLGGTVFWEVLNQGPVPAEFTEFRVGEAAFFGWNTSLGRAVAGLSNEVFQLELEVLEVWDKEVRAEPSGPPGFNAFGQRAAQTSLGLRRRAVLDGGCNFAPVSALTPLDPRYTLVGETHEYTVLDCQDSTETLRSGDLVAFSPAYEAVARSFLSPFLEWKRGEAT